MRALIIDGYIDEPSCLGVPPYVSPYPRYIYGLLKSYNIETEYITIDSLRKNNFYFKTFYDILIIISGLGVPGKYINTHLLTYSELIKISESNRKSYKIIVGSLNQGYTLKGGTSAKTVQSNLFDMNTSQNYLKEIFEYIDSVSDKKIDYNKENFISAGTEIVYQHHAYPNLIMEIETYSGCMRKERCSFCIEQFNKNITKREPEDIINEITELSKKGIKHFRLGNQPDIISYGASDKPDPEHIEKLLYGIRAANPHIETLHTDNANPAVISDFPKESKLILNSLVKYCSSGNVLALGAETFDKTVVKNNNLNSMPEQTYNAIQIINEIGSEYGENGLPKLLPGINLLSGLIDETEDTWKTNYEYLQKIMDNNLLLRRINIRQVIQFSGTQISRHNYKQNTKLKKIFEYYKDLIRKNIDFNMLKKILPYGSILKNAFAEIYKNNLTYLRQFGSYPILIGTRKKLETQKFYNMIITDHGYRSVTGIVYPADINTLSFEDIKCFSGINSKTANNILFSRPYKTYNDFLDLIPQEKKEYFDKFKNLIFNSNNN